ncbi:TatD family hydrolase [uncultured Ruthenibacterium sp.]|uniref:TatD family hydrolase n=1 Tax=uncultured Ruthenibacterium sp. TaxID=1905347 RepID=UPI00349E5214
MIFDTHSHYISHRFDDHRTQLLDSLPGQGVCAVVDCATDYDTANQCLALADKYPWLYVAAGIHPQSLIEEDASTRTRFGGDWRACGHRASVRRQAGGGRRRVRAGPLLAHSQGRASRSVRGGAGSGPGP